MRNSMNNNARKCMQMCEVTGRQVTMQACKARLSSKISPHRLTKVARKATSSTAQKRTKMREMAMKRQ